MSDKLLKAIENLENATVCFAYEQSKENKKIFLAARLNLLKVVRGTEPEAEAEFKLTIYTAPSLGSWFNYAATGVRVTHHSGIFEECHSERSQHGNKELAFKALKARLKVLDNINDLAKVHSTSYVSPHHITFTLEGLKNLILETQE